MSTSANFIFASLLPDVIAVKVKFKSTSQYYTYKALTSMGIEVGDTVVVDSPSSGMTLVEVKEVEDFKTLDPSLYNGYKWIVGKLNVADYTSVREREEKFRAQLEELRTKAKHKAMLTKLAEEVGGMANLNKLIAQVKGETKGGRRR
jgi:SepF-like predicted cell division protein (DUF552 family)